MNGQNTYNCSVISTTYPPNPNKSLVCTGGELSVTQVDSTKSYRFRLINHSSFFPYWFSIDNHTFSIVEIDGTEIEPIVSTGIYLNIGQRYSIIVTANQTVGNYYMRADLTVSCVQPYGDSSYTSSGLESINNTVLGILSYDQTDPKTPPIGISGNTTNPYGCNDLPFDIPVPKRTVPAFEVSPNQTFYVEYAFRQAQSINRIFINSTAWSPLENNATLWKAVDQVWDPNRGNKYNSWKFPASQQVFLVPVANQAAQIVINTYDVTQHPWHMHGMCSTFICGSSR
jgi:FtsP/CotA-like multicopper oxidase with cupredoxin domain